MKDIETVRDMAFWTAITLIAIYALEIILIIIGNSLTIFVFWTQKLHHKRAFLLLINLAIADLLVGIAEILILSTGKASEMTYVRKEDRTRNNHSSALQILPQSKRTRNSPLTGLHILASSTSVYFLALIALERVYAVLWPLRHRVTNTRVYIYGIVIVWVVGLCMAGLSLLPLYYTKVDRRYVTASIYLCLFIALLVICGSYIKIRNRLRSTSGKIASQSNRSTERNLRFSRTMFIVIAASLVFWLPTFAVYTVREFCKKCVSARVHWLVNAFHLANSMVNPFVYTFRMPIFKDALKKFRRKRRQYLEGTACPGRQSRVELGRYAHSPNGTYTSTTILTTEILYTAL